MASGKAYALALGVALAARNGRYDGAQAPLEWAGALAPGERGPSEVRHRLDGGVHCGLTR